MFSPKVLWVELPKPKLFLLRLSDAMNSKLGSAPAIRRLRYMSVDVGESNLTSF